MNGTMSIKGKSTVTVDNVERDQNDPSVENGNVVEEQKGAIGGVKPKRATKATPKAQQALVDSAMQKRKSKMKALTQLRSKMEGLMIDYDNEAQIREDIEMFNSLPKICVKA